MIEVIQLERNSGVDLDRQNRCFPDNPLAQWAHHWMIETPRGETSQGTCQRCHLTRPFRNSSNGRPWEDQQAVNSWDGLKPKIQEEAEYE